MIKRILIVTMLSFSIGACQPDYKSVNEEGINFKLQNIKEQIEGYRILKAIPLETVDNNWLGLNLNIKFNADGIFVLDEGNKDAVHHFDLLGRYIQPIALVGEGPENIQNVYDFTIGDSTVSVLTGKGDHSEISLFSYRNKLVKTLELDIIGDSFEIMENSNYIVYSGYNLPFAKFRLNEITPEGKIIRQNLQNNYKNNMLPIIEKNFYKYRGVIYFKESFNPNTYQITRDSLKLNYRFDFGKYRIPQKFWDVDIMQGFEMIHSEGFANIFNYMENENYALFAIYVQQDRNVQNIQVIYNKDDETVTRNTFQKGGNDIFYHPVGFSENNELIFVTHPVYLKEAIKLGNFDPAIKNLALDLDDNDNPVLLFCQID